MSHANQTTRRVKWKPNKNGCWVWQLSGSRGYGTVCFNGRKEYAHRVMYRMKYGFIPAFMDLDHLCRNRKCINPDHLEPVTRVENLRRGGNTKLTLKDVDSIRKRFKRGSGPGKRDGNAKQLANEFGISSAYVYNIIENRAWR